MTSWSKAKTSWQRAGGKKTSNEMLDKFSFPLLQSYKSDLGFFYAKPELLAGKVLNVNIPR